jgi:hypothetical protein
MSSYVVTVVVIGFIALTLWGAFRSGRLRQEAGRWPKIEAIVEEKVLIDYDPADYALIVSYKFSDQRYRSRAENFFDIRSSNKRIGERVQIKIDPDKPQRCVLFEERVPTWWW